MTTRDEIRHLLAHTTVPAGMVTELLGAAPVLWLWSAPPVVLARALSLCHPLPGPGEVRASVGLEPGPGAGPGRGDGAWRLNVAALDRPALLADTASVVSSEGLSVASASAVSWARPPLALHSLALAEGAPSAATVNRLTDQIGGLGPRGPHETAFEGTGRAEVCRSGEAFGDWVVNVTAPDQPGLLAAICRWFADHGSSIRAASVRTADGWARDVFVVSGAPDLGLLADHLSQPAQGPRWKLLRRGQPELALSPSAGP